MKTKTFSFTRQILLVFALMLFMTNVVLGIVLMKQSTDIIQRLVRKNMLNISNTAADILDGDVLAALSKEDVGSESYMNIYNDLTSFQNNVDIEYIYAVRKINDGRYIFTVDPDPEEPADFGDEVLITDALISASSGIAMVDNAPAEDAWGNFYSAYSPVYDSKGNIAGIVGVDFNSDWYDMQIREHTISIALMTSGSIAIGGLIVLIFTHNIRKRLDNISEELAILSSDVDVLTKEITSSDDYIENVKTYEDEDEQSKDEISEIELLESKLLFMHSEMDRYLAYIRNKANTDALTGVGNTTAYTQKVNELEQKITDKNADFSLAMFDINDLKGINDSFGHQYGDLIIKAAADTISSVFDSKNLYRIGGDEFIVIEEKMPLEKMNEMIRDVQDRVKIFNENDKEHKGIFALSVGTASFDKEKDSNFRSTFSRADDVMYRNKSEYYKHFHKLQK